ncbi:unnamed protein product [Clonostachys rhizophaga]|uniref:Long-chain-alcohol oxidase n=1 Tax=Clonostachys rhizophaga TaxID=160324 RepID=A0A9N9YL72_9HYPO|nr:unnamed protein product [Clonostachys rhizophaga]
MASSVASSGPASSFNDTHWDVLFKLLDAVVPPVVVVAADSPDSHSSAITISEAEFAKLYNDLQSDVKDPPSVEAFREYLAARASQNGDFVKTVKDMIDGLSPSVCGQLRFILGAMGSRLGGLISTGYFVPFDKQPAHTREAILQSWTTSWFSLWPMLARTFLIMAKACWARSTPLLEELTHYQSAIQSPKVQTGSPHNFNFMQFNASEPAVVETDVVIVGSGCGGGVCAKLLAEAGHRVLVVDRGYYFQPESLPMKAALVDQVLQAGGGLTTVDGSTMVIAGSSWGGGGSINWSVSLQTPDEIRQEWAKDGLPIFTSTGYQESLDRVCAVMGVNDKHNNFNFANKLIKEGAESLGWRFKVCPQNTADHEEHSCGASCGMGCREGKKQGPAVSWLPLAAKSGARFIEGFDVSKITFDDSNGLKKATGIEGTWTSRDASGTPFSREGRTKQSVQIKAKRVIVAGGAVNSPVLLQKSGLKNPNIGKHLKLHPCACFTAAFKEEVKPWEGPIATVVLTEFDNEDKKGYGPRVYSTAMHTLVGMLQLPWKNGTQYKVDALKYPHLVGYVAITRDYSSGSITPEPTDGSPVINYTPSPADCKHILIGLIATAKLCYLRGAIELAPDVAGVPPFRSQIPAAERSLSDTEFVQWLKQLETTGVHPRDSMFQSAHQMGSCRMGATAEAGVVDQTGKAWEAENLYLADSSIFPSAGGVNPMITTMAIADRVAHSVAAGL